MSSLRSTVLALTALTLLQGCDASDQTAPPAASSGTASGASAVDTCSTCVVGPIVLTRGTGAPVVHSWSVPATAGARFLLHLDDLGTQGANAQVFLNRDEIAWRFDETGTRRHHAVLELSLLAENTLTVRLTGRPGSQLRVALESVETVATATLTVLAENAGVPPTSGAFTGPANGRVTGPGIDCALVADVASGDCAEAYPLGTVVTLTATPGDRSLFHELFFEGPDGSFNYGCMQSGGSPCVVTMTSDSTLHVTFKPLPTFLHVTMVGPGVASAWIRSNEIECYLDGGVQGGDCMSRYEGGVLYLTLRAFPNDAQFAGWSGACSGTSLECPLTSQPGDTLHATATFNP
jgi:hypothetical protein